MSASKELGQLNVTTEEVKNLADYAYNQLLKDAIRGQCLEFHRAIKLGFFFLEEPKEDEEKYEIVHRSGVDVFGQVPKSRQFDCSCPVCKWSVSATRFASHLAKCMGFGRNSSRRASERIANAGKVEVESEVDDYDNYDNDSDWNDNSDRKSAKKKKEKNTPRRLHRRKARNGGGGGGGSIDSTDWNYDLMSIEQKHAIFDQVCGVVSEHTKKVCTRSLRCPQHTNEQRKQIRDSVLGRHCADDDAHIDVDTVD